MIQKGDQVCFCTDRLQATIYEVLEVRPPYHLDLVLKCTKNPAHRQYIGNLYAFQVINNYRLVTARKKSHPLTDFFKKY